MYGCSFVVCPRRAVVNFEFTRLLERLLLIRSQPHSCLCIVFAVLVDARK